MNTPTIGQPPAESPSSPLASLLAGVDPATLKAKDRAVLLDLLERAFDAADARASFDSDRSDVEGTVRS